MNSITSYSPTEFEAKLINKLLIISLCFLITLLSEKSYAGKIEENDTSIFVGLIGAPLLFLQGGISAQLSYQYSTRMSFDLEAGGFGTSSGGQNNSNVGTRFISAGTSVFLNQFVINDLKNSVRPGPDFLRFAYSYHDDLNSGRRSNSGRRMSNGLELSLGFRMKAAKVGFEIVPISVFLPIDKTESGKSTKNKGSVRILQFKIGFTY